MIKDFFFSDEISSLLSSETNILKEDFFFVSKKTKKSYMDIRIFLSNETKNNLMK